MFRAEGVIEFETIMMSNRHQFYPYCLSFSYSVCEEAKKPLKIRSSATRMLASGFKVSSHTCFVAHAKELFSNKLFN